MAVKRPPQVSGGARDFSGGPNIRDAASELQPNESVDAWNVTFDERGGVHSRKGHEKTNGTPFGAGVVQNVFWSSILGARITQAGASLYLADVNTIRKTFTTSERVGFAEIAGKIVAGHLTDGLFTSTDGITWTAVADVDAPKGNALEPWNNKLWVAGQGTARLSWSNAGDATAWTATDFNDLRSKDNEKAVALKVASGLDVLGRAGLVACKQESSYRIYDSATGAYEVIDATVGAASNIAIVGVGAKVLTISKRGISWWAAGQVGMVNASDRYAPLWDSGQVNFGQLDLWCAGRKKNRAVFSLTRAGSTANDLSLEYHPDQDWLAPGSNAMSAYTTSTGTVETTYGGAPTVSGQVYTLDSGGTDDGTGIAFRFQSRWFELSAGYLASVWQIRLQGRGSGTLTVIKDYASGGGDAQVFDFDETLNQYDSGLHYDTGETYSIPAFQNTEAFFSIGVCREFSLKLTGTATTVVSAPQVLGAGTAPTVGEFGLYSIQWLHTPLGLS